jgi:trimeric autotransporter adhesin
LQYSHRVEGRRHPRNFFFLSGFLPGMAIRLWARSVFIGILFAASALSQQYTITTIAGSPSNPGFAGDSGSAVGAQLNGPFGLAVDKSGTLYIADGLNNRVRKVSGGVITTVAGNGTAGFTGDNASATSAELNNPTGVAVDSSGNLYIADSGNNVVRKVANGTITTFAGNNSTGAGYSGDGAAATGAQLNNPVGVAVDGSGNVYIADAGNNAVRQVGGGNIITAAVGFTHPDGVAVDSSGNLYVADTVARRIVKFSGGVYTTVAGTGSPTFGGDDGPGPQAALNAPMGLAVDASGNVYIADTLNGRIRKLTPAGTITTIAGTGALYFSGDQGPATQAALYFPRGVAVDRSGNIYIADTANSVVRQLQGILPAISANGVVNAASFATQVSPGALATVFGSNFALRNASAKAPLPLSLGGVSVSVNGQSAPLLYVTPTQVNFQVPWETTLGSATITVNVNGGASNSITVPVLGAAPGLFSTSSGHAVVQNSDFTLNDPTNPAKVGSTIVAYLSGSGPVSPAVADGAATPLGTLVSATSQSSAAIGSSTAQVAFAGLAPGFVGLVQVNIVVPSDLQTGDYPLAITIGNETSNPALLSVTR